MFGFIKKLIPIAAVYMWIGFVGSISFMEAWLKFRAPGVTLEIGLGIGRLVFGYLNKVEWAFAILILICITSTCHTIKTAKNLFYFFSLLILTIQTFYLLPLLDDRALQYINHLNPSPSKLHMFYIILEFIKTLGLFAFGIKQFEKTSENLLTCDRFKNRYKQNKQ